MLRGAGGAVWRVGVRGGVRIAGVGRGGWRGRGRGGGGLVGGSEGCFFLLVGFLYVVWVEGGERRWGVDVLRQHWDMGSGKAAKDVCWEPGTHNRRGVLLHPFDGLGISHAPPLGGCILRSSVQLKPARSSGLGTRKKKIFERWRLQH